LLYKDNKVAAGYCRRAKEAYESGDFESALKLLDKAQESFGDLEMSDNDRKRVQEAFRFQAAIYKKIGKFQEAEECMKEAKRKEKVQVGLSLFTDWMIPFTKIALFINQDMFGEAIKVADSLDTSHMGTSETDGLTWAMIGDVYFRDLDNNLEKAKKAYLKAREIFELSGKRPEVLMKVYVLLGKIAGAECNREKALAYCEKAWSAAKIAGFENCPASDLAMLTNTGTHSDARYSTKWIERALEASTKLLKSGNDKDEAARLYVLTALAYYMTTATLDHPLINDSALASFLAIKKSSPTTRDEAIATWIAACVLTKDPAWLSNSAHTKNVLSMLRSAIRLVKADGHFDQPFSGYNEQKVIAGSDSIVACANGLIADYHMSQGDLERAAAEYAEGLRLMKRHYEKDYFFERFQKGLDKAQGKS
jgi:tetratricopeptide (TPR) repeat protein